MSSLTKFYKIGFLPTLIALLLFASVIVYAQTGNDYALSWWTVDGGGTTANHAGAYNWNGTTGQPDAGTLSEGAYTFRGGFWGGVFSPLAYQSMQSGAWGTGGTWDQSVAPGYNAIVTIRTGDTVTVSNKAIGYRLIVEHGATLIIQEGAALTIRDTVVNSGTLRQMQSVDGSAPVTFLSLGNYRGVDLTTDNDLGPVTVTVGTLASGEYCTADGAVSPSYARRCFRIQPTHNLSATVRLWVLADEIPFAGTPAAFHNPGGTNVWTELTAHASHGTVGDYVYAAADTPGFSYFLVAQSGQSPTRVGLRALLTHRSGVIGVLLFGLGITLLILTQRYVRQSR
ncbi:MAG TPA: hypothetical protein PKH77_08585 [Anaerolineae bacterium]|nr:hypothetical protein [Anaerolineae bacterium]